VDSNVRVGRGEIDILVEDRGRRVAVEVKTAVIDTAERGDALDAFDDAKAAQVCSLARIIGARRVDLVAVGLRPDGVQIRWVPDV
jgi:Holliday junction resolvase-like predicted endonuclease